MPLTTLNQHFGVQGLWAIIEVRRDASFFLDVACVRVCFRNRASGPGKFYVVCPRIDRELRESSGRGPIRNPRICRVFAPYPCMVLVTSPPHLRRE